MSFDPSAQLRPGGYLLDDLDYISEREAAPALNVAQQTLVKYRKLGVGPPYSVVGRTVMYSRANLKLWLDNGGTCAFLESGGTRERVARTYGTPHKKGRAA